MRQSLKSMQPWGVCLAAALVVITHRANNWKKAGKGIDIKPILDIHPFNPIIPVGYKPVNVKI